jgi:hypothetical protein
MVSSNSSIDWTKLMTAEENAEFVKTPEFREWLLGLLSDETNPTTVTFTKKDGTERVMRCTRSPAQIPEDQHPKNGTNDSETSLRVFDLDKNEWRSFIVENVKRIEYSLS